MKHTKGIPRWRANYWLKMAAVPRLAHDSLAAKDLISQGKPVVLTNGCPLVSKATDWSFTHLATVILPEFPCDVYASQTRRFMYWDNAKNSSGYTFTAPTRKETMSFSQFLEVVNNKESVENYYLQSGVVAEMGPAMLHEYTTKFSLENALLYKLIGDWDGFTSNLLLCGQEGVITPLHYDEQQNMFGQLWGRKRVRLFQPEAFSGLYPFPLGHPCDRQSQVTLPSTPGSTELSAEDEIKFPAYSTNAAPFEVYADLEPGEVLYVPQYWWHQMEALSDNTSLSWWYKDLSKAAKAVSVDENGNTKVDPKKVSTTAVRRNVENLIRQSLPNGKQAHLFFLALAAGLLEDETVEVKSEMAASASCAQGVLAADHARRAEVAALVQESWKEILEQAIKMVRMLPFFKERSEAKEFLLELARGRFHSLAVETP